MNDALPKRRSGAPSLSAGCSGTGLIMAALFMSAALTPSLIPRSPALQGVLCGISLVAGFAVGGLLTLAWRAFELPEAGKRLQRPIIAALSLIAAAAVAASLWLSIDWQNATRVSVGMAPLSAGSVLTVVTIAAAVAAALLGLWRFFELVMRFVERRAGRFLSRPIARGFGFFGAALLFWSIGNGLLLSRALQLLDRSYAALDATTQTHLPLPRNTLKTGSPASLIAWPGIGREGRNVVAAWPGSADIASLSRSAAKEPIRVYVGLNSAASPEARAALALAELQRIGAFNRKLLVIATPTGTGWLDPAGIAPLEILHRGDVATVAVQYSYLPSWLALFVAPDYGEATARAVFQKIHGHWATLPRNDRPKLFLFGLSLGALNSSLSNDLIDVVGDPYDGALWAGPPFASRTWQMAVQSRVVGSPVWRPVFRDKKVVRFANRGTGFLAAGEDPDRWGPFRIGYLVYSGDPISIFEPRSLFERPAWLSEPRAPDLPPGLHWYPVVTFLQGLLDVITATQVPPGHGHVYAARDYLHAWADLTSPTGWTEADLARVNAAMKDRHL